MLNDGVFLAILAAIVLLLIYLLHRLISCRNTLDWADLIATRGSVNAYKCGYLVGVLLGAWVVVKQTYLQTLDAATFATYLAFLAGVSVASSAVGSRSATKPTEKKSPISRNDDPVIL